MGFVKILIADDDREDVELVSEALKESGTSVDLFRVENGVELIDYLSNQGQFEDVEKYPRPDLILLDLNMPKMDGRAALHKLKGNEKYKKIPVVVLTTSEAEEDVVNSYDLGANGYLSKPVTFDALVSMLKSLVEYWFGTVKLPTG